MGPPPLGDGIVIRDAADGSVTIMPLQYETPRKGTAKEYTLGEQNTAEKQPTPASSTLGQTVVTQAEPGPAIVPGGGAEPGPAIVPGCGSPSKLGPCATAAVNALQTRSTAKKKLNF